MLTALSIQDGKKDPTVLYAPQLLGMLQQALPGFQKPTGTGVVAAPWAPTKPAEWWYCAKEKPKATGGKERFTTDATGVAWLKVGGKYISIKTDTFYASQHAAPAGGATGAPKTTFEDLTYSEIYSKMTDRAGAVRDAATAAQMRKLLKGSPGGAEVLPLLTSVLFVSEVARNHTAFHTNLMMLDLVEKGISITQGTNFKYSFQTVLWNPKIIDSVMALQQLEQRKAGLQDQQASLNKLLNKVDRGWRLSNNQWVRVNNSNEEFEQINTGFSQVNSARGAEFGKIGAAKAGMDEAKNPTLASRGGEAAQPGGIASMSHKGSAYGAAYDLERQGEYRGVKQGSAFTKPPTAMTIVRRKEATLLIRWLETALKAAGIQATALVDDPKLETAGLYNGIANSFGRNDDAFMKVLQLMQKRVDTFDLML